MEEEKVLEENILPAEAPVDNDIQPNAAGEEKKAVDFAPQQEEILPSENEKKPVVEPRETEVSRTGGDASSGDLVKALNGSLKTIAETEQQLFTEVREMHKLYHAEYVGRLRTMQNELDKYHEIERGRAFDELLSSVARIYSNNETLADEVQDPKVKKSIRYLLMDLEELLEDYGVEKIRSKPGDARNTRHCQILNRVITDDPEKNNKVARSYNSGFAIANRTIIKEMVDLYLYEEQETEEPQKVEPLETVSENKEDNYNG